MLKYSEFAKHRNSKEQEMLTEGFFGNIMKKLKDKVSLSLSKKIGGAKTANKLIQQREEELTDNLKKRLKAEEEVLLAKQAYTKSDNDETLRLQYEQKKKALKGMTLSLTQMEKASKKKFDINIKSIKGKNAENINDYIELRVAEMNLTLATIEYQSYEKMNRDTSRLQKKLETHQQKIQDKNKEITDRLRKRTEEGKIEIKIDADKEYSYVNSKGKELTLKILNPRKDDEGFITVINKEKEGTESEFRVKPEDLKEIEKEEKGES